MMNQDPMEDSEQPVKQSNIYGILGFWVSIISIICMFGLIFINKWLFTLGLLGMMISIILSMIGLLHHAKGFAIAGIVINVIILIAVIILVVVFLPMIVAYS
ncbi:MAG: hypothetical protein ACRCXK_01105 [Wohlfahrtiimonas sp.]